MRTPQRYACSPRPQPQTQHIGLWAVFSIPAQRQALNTRKTTSISGA